ncbi:MAG: hypothetical protein IJ689_06790 [Alphaproteobacteria bacterium]|nr:hypothetical protein [Alphaproteobacteria bacterium]
MKNYILLIGVASVALGSYYAYAANSATMTVTATINHDVSLTGTGNINLGTITINPAGEGYGSTSYNSDGTLKAKTDPVTAATAATPGTFTANIANPSACNGTSYTCGGLSVDYGKESTANIMGGDASSEAGCTFVIAHDSSNTFKVVPSYCGVNVRADPGDHEATITISYNAS